MNLACSLLAPSDEELQGGRVAFDAGEGAGGTAAALGGAGGTAPVAGGAGREAPVVGSAGQGGTSVAVGGAGAAAPVDAGSGAGGRLDGGETPVACGVPVDCVLPACEGVACADFGRLCIGSACVCLGGDAPEADCANGADDDCDGLDDCADPDCDRARCGGEQARRCCAGRCADTTQDEEHCQGCDLRCAPGQLCVRIEDASGVRGHCGCDATSECPNNPAQICRQMNDDGQDDLCACDVLQTGNAGCATGQTCLDVPLANFCRYPP